jgi:hypothetical protein
VRGWSAAGDDAVGAWSAVKLRGSEVAPFQAQSCDRCRLWAQFDSNYHVVNSCCGRNRPSGQEDSIDNANEPSPRCQNFDAALANLVTRPLFVVSC